jgi:tRNA threonylcarbamoyladenosine biosynthesis protein TsaB
MDSMESLQRVAVQPGLLLLGIDTCGPTGYAALGRLVAGAVELLGQIELEGRSYSATLVAAVLELLHRGEIHPSDLVPSDLDPSDLDPSDLDPSDLGAIVVVNGPGSFTGVRVGLSAVKGLAEGARIPVTAVSRLEVLAWKAGVEAAAIDAHRGEIFLRMSEPSSGSTELLAGAEDLARILPVPHRIATCGDAATALLAAAWPEVTLVPTDAPTAADALTLCAARVAAREFVDLALLDGHYLRRSDAEIFGETAGLGKRGA